jgi:hypothetical protein
MLKRLILPVSGFLVGFQGANYFTHKPVNVFILSLAVVGVIVGTYLTFKENS